MRSLHGPLPQSGLAARLTLPPSQFDQQYTPANTIHVDDLSRNFALNPSNGLKVKAYKVRGRPPALPRAPS